MGLIVDSPLSTLTFLRFAPNLELLDVSGCRNLVDDDFTIVKDLSSLCQLYVSFTAVKPHTLADIVQHKSITVLDACGVKFGVTSCKSVLEHVKDSIVSLSISLDIEVSEQAFKHELRHHLKKCRINIHRQ